MGLSLPPESVILNSMPEPTAKPATIVSESTAPKLQPAPPLVKKLDTAQKRSPMKTLIIVILIILAGIGSGYGLNRKTSSTAGMKSTADASKEGLKVGDVFGSNDEKSFKDPAEGVLVKGGIEGEGSHHLLRPGGPTQNLFLTSSIVDLDLFVDHKIKVWGETFAAQKAGWLMDVGRIEVVELNASKPFEEEIPAQTSEE